MNAWEIYFKYLSSQKMAHTKSSVRRRQWMGEKLYYQLNPQLNLQKNSKHASLGKQ